MSAPSTDDLIARLRHAAPRSGGAGGPRCLQTAAADRLETLRKAAEGMADAARIFAKAVIRSRQLNEFDQSAYCSPRDMVTTGDFHVLAAALAAYEATK